MSYCNQCRTEQGKGDCPMCKATIIGVDISDGIVTHVEGFYKNGVLHITDRYDIIDGDRTNNERDE